MRRGSELAILVLAIACSPVTTETGSDGTWVGTITTEGNVTTVVNESGSVWGGAARLVEEVTIGVESGAEEYMFGRIGDIYANDQAIFVVDRDVPAVRMYDAAGEYVRDIGRSGQGPGEYTRPIQVAAASDGRVFVVDNRTRRINVFDAAGAPIGAYPLEGRVVCCNQPLVIDDQNVPWLAYQALDPSDPGSLIFTIRALGPQGIVATRQIPSVDFEPQSVSLNGRDFAVPFAAFSIWNFTRSGVVVGTSDSYRFEIHRADARIIVERKGWSRVPVAPAEAAYMRSVWIQQGMAPPGWDGAQIPEHKAAFLAFQGSTSGDLWVLRPGPGIRDLACNEPDSGVSCWKDSFLVDAFDPGGRFLGSVDLPREMRDPLLSVRPFRNGKRVVAVVENDAGTIMVKRYRLVLPGEDAP